MADIDQIIAGGAGASSRADFSGIPKLLDSYWAGKDQAAKNDLRDAFKPTAQNPSGVPLTPEGQLDLPAVMKTLFQKGDIAGGTGLIGQVAGAQDRSDYIKSLSPQPPANLGPPSANRAIPIAGNAPVRAAPAGTASSPQGDQPGSIVGMISAAGIPDELAGPYIAQISAMTKTDPNAALDPQTSSRVQQVVQAAAQRMKGGQPQQPGGLTPQAPQQPPQMAPQGFQPSPAQVAAQNDPELKRARYFAASQDKAIAEANRAEVKMKLEALQPTNEMKHAAAMGIPLKESLDRTDENTTQRDILTKSLIPRIDKSQETATAARDDIDAIHRARGELDRKGGVFSGAYADQKLYMAKAAELLGIQNADKIQNTEAYGAAIGSRVASMVKAFGSGTAISDGDRRFAAAMAGGQVTLDEGSMRRILEIGEKAARGKIDYHNQFVDKVVKANEGLNSARDSFIVKAPGQYQKPDAASLAAFSAARSAIDKGAPRDAVMKRLKENGHNPADL